MNDEVNNLVDDDYSFSDANTVSPEEVLDRIESIKQEISRLQAKQAELENMLVTEDGAAEDNLSVQFDGGLFEFANFRIIDQSICFELTYHNQSDAPQDVFSAFILNMSYYQQEDGLEESLLTNGYPDPNSPYDHFNSSNPDIQPDESMTVTAAFSLVNEGPVIFSNIFSPNDSITIDLNTLN